MEIIIRDSRFAIFGMNDYTAISVGIIGSTGTAFGGKPGIETESRLIVGGSSSGGSTSGTACFSNAL